MGMIGALSGNKLHSNKTMVSTEKLLDSSVDNGVLKQ